MHTRRNNATFTILVTVAIALGGLAMAGVLLGLGAPGALVAGTLLAAIPVGPLVACYLWLDRYEPEPRSLLALGLAWGAFVATSVALVLQAADHFATGAALSRQGVLTAPVTEEAAKGLFILLLLWFRRHELDGILDGIVYAGMVGIGFAFTENIMYLTSQYMGDGVGSAGLEGAVQLFIFRCIFSPFAHPLFTAFIGIGIGIAVGARSLLLRIAAPVIGYVIAVALHAGWNANFMLVQGPAALGTYVVVMVPAFLMVVGFALWARGREARVLTAALDDAARRGLLDPAEIPWLVRLPGRRILRRYAAKNGGPEARRAMIAYQTHAIELGYLHHRFLRGTPPSDFAELGAAHVAAMNGLRPYLLWPQRTDRNDSESVRGSMQGSGGAR